MLLSLTNVISSAHVDRSRKDRTLFHLLAIGHHTAEIRRLLSYASSLAPIRCHQNSSNELFSTVTRDRFGANAFIDGKRNSSIDVASQSGSQLNVYLGGSLLLSTDGICLIDDILGLKKETLKRLQTSW